MIICAHGKMKDKLVCLIQMPHYFIFKYILPKKTTDLLRILPRISSTFSFYPICIMQNINSVGIVCIPFKTLIDKERHLLPQQMEISYSSNSPPGKPSNQE